MINTSLVTLTDSHIMTFVPRENYGVDLLELRKKLLRIRKNEGNFTFALVANGEVLAILGATKQTECCMELWAFPSALVPRLTVLYSNKVKDHCQRFMEVSDAHRFIIAIDEEKPEWIKWAQFLGFEMECFARGYNPDGSAAYIFSKVVKKWQQGQ